MKRSDFLKATAVIGTGAVLSIRQLLNEKKAEALSINDHKKAKVAIDLESIDFKRKYPRTDFPTAAEILKIYNETGVLIYSSALGQPPVFTDAIEVTKLEG